MLQEVNKTVTSAGSASVLQLLTFTLLGALSATLWQWHISAPTDIGITPASTETLNKDDARVSSNVIDMSKVKILSLDPFIAHITDFVTTSERQHLLNLGAPLLKKSVIIDDSGTEVQSTGRTSSTAFLPEADPIVAAIAARAADFQGFLSPTDIDVQITSYNPGQQYKHHYDWYPSPRPKNRISTFFAILKSTCDDCGTEFPFFNISERATFDKRWCDVLDCSKELLTTKNVKGSALFWINLDSKAKGRLDTLHAGLPALNGEKVGLNVWTDIDLEEVKRRGMFRSQNRHFYQPSKEFLVEHGLMPPEDGEKK